MENDRNMSSSLPPKVRTISDRTRVPDGLIAFRADPTRARANRDLSREVGHECPDLGFGLRPDAAASPKLAHKMTVAQRTRSKRSGAKAVLLNERFYVSQECHGLRCKCDIAHRQGVFHRDYATCGGQCETSHMHDFDMEAFRARLQSLMDAQGIKRKPLAKAAGLGETSIRDIFDADRNDVRAGTLVKLAGYFDVTIEDLISEPHVGVAGRIGAGGEVYFEAEDSPQMVDRPPGAHGKVMALEVVGSSMLPKYEEGDIVFVRRDIDGIPRGAIGKHCAVHTADGGTFLKILSKGSVPGRYTLRSLNAPDMEDVEVVWAAPVKWVTHRDNRD